MAGFEENDLYEAFGLEQPKEGGNDPEPAEPGAEVQEQGEEPGADSAHEPPEDRSSPRNRRSRRTRTAAVSPPSRPRSSGRKMPGAGGRRSRRRPSRRRGKGSGRRAGEVQADMAAFFARANLKNTVTGKPITTMEEFDAWRADYDAAKLQKDLKAGKLTPEALRSAVEQTPALQELRKQQEQRAAADAEQKRAAAQAQVGPRDRGDPQAGPLHQQCAGPSLHGEREGVLRRCEAGEQLP